MSALRVEGLRQRHAEQEVLRGVDLTLQSGAVLAVLGASGCGKTTLLRAIAGFEAPTSGTIRLGERVLDAPGVHLPVERRRIGYVPQEGTLFPHLTVAANVAFGLDRAGRRNGRVAEALLLARLEGLETRYPHQLSGGQQQRVALARALAPRPGLILLDEPFNAIDLALRRRVCAEVIGVLREGAATAILVTHDPQEAFASADLVAVMHAGLMTQCADPTIVYRRPATLETARLTGGTVELDAIVHDDGAHTALGVLPLLPGSLAAGAARVMLRPEQIVPCGCGQGVGVRQVASVFRGDHALVTIAVDGVELDLRLGSAVDPSVPLHLRVTGGCMAYDRIAR